VTVGADLVRLAIDPQLNIVRERRQATFALLSADLAELAVAGRLELRGNWLTERIVITDPRPTGDPLLDRSLAALTAAKRPDFGDWVREKLRCGVLEDYLSMLASQFDLLLHQRRVGGRFTRHLLTEATLLEPGRAARHRALQRLAAYVAGPPPRSTPAGLLEWAFAGLAFEGDLATLIYPCRRHKDTYRCLRAAARARPQAGDPPAAAVISAAIQAARTGANEGYD
jgi:hypothetical protein